MKTVLVEAGISYCPALFKDRLFPLAIVASIPVLVVLRFFIPAETAPELSVIKLLFFFVLWTPFWEELLFRGIVQGQLLLRGWGRKQVLGLSYANWTSSIIFVIAHVFSHSPFWAIPVLIPSLVFGYFRERHQSVLPPYILHGIYNFAYLLAFDL